MHVEARPICPHCGSPLFARARGEMTCVSHGAFYGHELLETTFGIGSAEYARQMAEHAVQVPRKCPLDRYALSVVRNASGKVQGDGCGRCGSVWLTWDTIDAVIASTPGGHATTQADARSEMGLASVRSILTPAGKAPRRPS